MNIKRRIPERKEAIWSAHNSCTIMNVCMHEIKIVYVPNWLRVRMCVCVLYFTVYSCMCS